MKYLSILIVSLLCSYSYCQSSDFLGAGNDDGISISTSSNFFNTKGENTINGLGLDVESMEASRFLAQATLGFNADHIKQVKSLGIENWTDYQFFSRPYSNITLT